MSPSNKSRVPSSPEEWMTHAESDLHLARIGKEHAEVLPEQVCFHAQQAVEKALKAVFRAHDADFPMTHDIEDLLEIAEREKIEIPPEILEAGRLTPYAVETRYPGFWDDISTTDADDAIHLAGKVVEWAKQSLTLFATDKGK